MTHTWVSANALRNYLLRDPFLDWAEHHHDTYGESHPKYAEALQTKHRTASSFPRHGRREWAPVVEGQIPPHNVVGLSFVSTIMQQGRAFESKVVTHLFREHGAQNMVHADHSYERTLAALDNKIPIIYRGVLHCSKTNTFGSPDLLVRADWLRRIVNAHVRVGPECDEEYRVVDIKHATLDLHWDGTHVKNSGSFRVYKGQLYVYARALSALRGQSEIPVAYLLGKGWKYTVEGEARRGTSCFDRLACVDFRPGGVDDWVPTEVRNATAWLNLVRIEGHAWDPLDVEGRPAELAPNMCNLRDYPWRKVKETVAELTGDITQLWMCGPKERARARADGFLKWSETEFSSDAVALPSENHCRILKQVVEVNKRDAERAVYPAVVSDSVFYNHSGQVEFFVDFETINLATVDNLSTFPEAEPSIPRIFLIGVGYAARRKRGPRVQTRTQKKRELADPNWVYRSFAVRRLDSSEESRIALAFYQYVCSVHRARGGRGPPLCLHWGHAEPSGWRRAVQNRYPCQWTDLLVAFKAEPIAIKGCFNYSLKNVAAALKRLGHISTAWPVEIDGLDAMLIGYRAYQECSEWKFDCTPLTSPKLTEVIRYNSIDCRVLMDILFYFRRTHTAI